MALKHLTVATNPQSPLLDNTDWNAAHVIDAGGLTFNDGTIQKTAGLAPIQGLVPNSTSAAAANSTLIQAAIAAGGTVWLPAGKFYVNVNVLSATQPGTLRGAGANNGAYFFATTQAGSLAEQSAGTTLATTSRTGWLLGIDISGYAIEGIHFQNESAVNGAGIATAGGGVRIGSEIHYTGLPSSQANGFNMEKCSCYGFYVNVDHYSADAFNIINNRIINHVYRGIRLNNFYNPNTGIYYDFGDPAICENQIVAGIFSANTVAVEFLSGGGVRFQNNKINGNGLSNPAYYFLDGFVYRPFPGGSTQTLTAAQVIGNTSATLSVAWPNITGYAPCTFSSGENRIVLFTAGSTAISWTPALTQNATTTLTVNGMATSVFPMTGNSIEGCNRSCIQIDCSGSNGSLSAFTITGNELQLASFATSGLAANYAFWVRAGSQVPFNIYFGDNVINGGWTMVQCEYFGGRIGPNVWYVGDSGGTCIAMANGPSLAFDLNDQVIVNPTPGMYIATDSTANVSIYKSNAARTCKNVNMTRAAPAGTIGSVSQLWSLWIGIGGNNAAACVELQFNGYLSGPGAFSCCVKRIIYGTGASVAAVLTPTGWTDWYHAPNATTTTQQYLTFDFSQGSGILNVGIKPNTGGTPALTNSDSGFTGVMSGIITMKVDGLIQVITLA